MPVWELLSPDGVLHTVREEARLRQLCKERSLAYDRLAKHVRHKPLRDKEPWPSHVKGWKLLSNAQWLQCGDTVVCVVGARTIDFINLANTYARRHPVWSTPPTRSGPWRRRWTRTPGACARLRDGMCMTVLRWVMWDSVCIERLGAQDASSLR